MPALAQSFIALTWSTDKPSTWWGSVANPACSSRFETRADAEAFIATRREIGPNTDGRVMESGKRPELFRHHCGGKDGEILTGVNCHCFGCGAKLTFADAPPRVAGWDDYTYKHLAEWINAHPSDEDRVEIRRNIYAAARTDPSCLERGRSWPEMRDKGADYRGACAARKHGLSPCDTDAHDAA